MNTATVRELRNHPSRLVSRISEGEEINITRRRQPIATLVPIKRKFPEPINCVETIEVAHDESSDRISTAWESQTLKVPSQDWRGEILSERERLISSGEETYIDWQVAKKQLRGKLQ